MAKSSSKRTTQQSARKQPVAPDNSSSKSGFVPRGLARRPVCNEYRGAVLKGDLPPSMQREEAAVAVLCICDGIPCRKCGTGRIHRPISNYWDEAKGGFVHCPWFSGLGTCDSCRAQPGRRTA